MTGEIGPLGVAARRWAEEVRVGTVLNEFDGSTLAALLEQLADAVEGRRTPPPPVTPVYWKRIPHPNDPWETT